MELQPWSFYIAEQNEKTEKQFYTFIAPVYFIRYVTNLPNFFYGEILRNPVFLKNKSQKPDSQTLFERLNHKKLDLLQLKVIEA